MIEELTSKVESLEGDFFEQDIYSQEKDRTIEHLRSELKIALESKENIEACLKDHIKSNESKKSLLSASLS